jgi:hypothetical protein
MNVSALRAYDDKQVELSENANIDRDTQKLANQGTKQFRTENQQARDTIITSKERDFFINMFPANSEQLKKHTIFNKNGQIQSTNVGKGKIIDGRA